MKKIISFSIFFVLAGALSAENYQYSSPQSTYQEKPFNGDITIKIANDPNLGKFLTDSKGKTLYMFTPDKDNTSACYDQCAVTWPPLLISSGKPVLAPGISGTLSTINRRDNTLQVTYNGMPLYYYVKDKKPGDIYGQNVDNTWFIINPKENVQNGMTSTKSAAIQLNKAMRKLWEDHIVYTRNLIISALANLQDANQISARLLRNQDDIGNVIKTYYGEAAGNQLSKLLKDHILIAVEVVKAAQSGSDGEVKRASDKWSANANDIAVFLSNANPNWPKQTLVNMLQKHLDLTTDEVISRINGKWSEDIEAFDNGHEHIFLLSDTLSDGIVKQFPEKFKN